MLRNLLLYFCLLITPLCCFAQRKEITKAADLVKSGKNLETAEQSMRKLLNDSANRDNEKIWRVMFDAMQKQYEQGNEKLYLKQKYDTAQLFNIASRMFKDMEAFDSIDAKPDAKGRVRTKMRKQNSALLNQLRPNLYNGGVFFISKKKYDNAYELLDQYIETTTHPMFGAFHYAEKDKRIPEAAYWASYCGYKLNNAKKILHHTYLALKDTTHYESMLQLLTTAYQLDGDSTRYIKTLKEGFGTYPRSPFFYSHLVDFYSANKQWEEALALSDKALKADSTNLTALLAKSTLLLNIADYRRGLMQAWRNSTKVSHLTRTYNRRPKPANRYNSSTARHCPILRNTRHYSHQIKINGPCHSIRFTSTSTWESNSMKSTS